VSAPPHRRKSLALNLATMGALAIAMLLLALWRASNAVVLIPTLGLLVLFIALARDRSLVRRADVRRPDGGQPRPPISPSRIVAETAVISGVAFGLILGGARLLVVVSAGLTCALAIAVLEFLIAIRRRT
jgi:hypothetical protein